MHTDVWETEKEDWFLNWTQSKVGTHNFTILFLSTSNTTYCSLLHSLNVSATRDPKRTTVALSLFIILRYGSLDSCPAIRYASMLK